MKRYLYFFMLITAISYSQKVQWQQSIGGRQSDYLSDMKSTPDYGIILAGSSVSQVSGNKTEVNKGSLDYFLWKLDENGKEEWQRGFGGDQADFLNSVNLTHDGGYVLGGSSYSGISGDKKDSCRGQDDFWILKLNAKSDIEWQRTIGGSGSDKLLSIQQTSDLGYIIGGSSDSGVSSDKTEPAQGAMDFWIVKLDAKGKI